MNFLTVTLSLVMVFGLLKAHASPVKYKDGSTELEGYLVRPKGDENIKRPVVLIVHAWTGLDDYARKRAEQVAEQGYIGFAVDMYGEGKMAKDHLEAAKLSGAFRDDRSKMRKRMKAAYDFAKNLKGADPQKIAALGYCFGGGAVLELARSGADVKAVASFHGNLDTPHPKDAKNIRGKVLVLNGAADPHVKASEIAAFEKEMEDGKVDWQFINYGGAVHAFTDFTKKNSPHSGIAYNEKADRRSWQATMDLFKEVF